MTTSSVVLLQQPSDFSPATLTKVILAAALGLAVCVISVLPGHSNPCQDYQLASSSHGEMLERHGKDHELEKVARERFGKASKDVLTHIKTPQNRSAVEAVHLSMYWAIHAHARAEATWGDEDLLVMTRLALEHSHVALEMIIWQECGFHEK